RPCSSVPSQSGGTAKQLPARRDPVEEDRIVGWFGFGKKATYIVAVAYEGPNRLRLNGNLVREAKIKRNAASHSQTIIWMELTTGGGRIDQGTGPAATRLEPGELERIQK